MGGCWKEQGTDKKLAFISDGQKEASSERGDCLAQRTIGVVGLENRKGERAHSIVAIQVLDKRIKIPWARDAGPGLILN